MSAALPLTRLGGAQVLFLMAASAEYGPHLRARFSPVMIGVGPVEAGVNATATLARLRAKGSLPDLVVSLGSAGSARLEQCAVYQASAVAYRDMDASPFGFARGVTPFLDLPARLNLPLSIPDLPMATLSTGGHVVSGTGYEGIAEDMVDMESYAILRACQLFDVPLVVLRGISDGVAPLEGVADWTAYLHVIDEHLAGAVDRLEEALTSGLMEAYREKANRV